MASVVAATTKAAATKLTQSAAATTSSSTVLTSTGSNSSRSLFSWALGGWLFFIAENAILSENRTALIRILDGGDTTTSTENTNDNNDSSPRYHALYGMCSTLATGSILYSYRRLRLQSVGQSPPFLGALPPALRLGVAASLVSLGLVLASQTLPKVQIPVEFAARAPSQSSSIRMIPQEEDSVAAVVDVTPPLPVTSPAWQLKVRCPFDFSDQKPASSDDDGVTGLARITRHPGLWAFGLVAAGHAAVQPTAALTLWMLGPALTAWLGGSHSDSRYRRGLGGTLHAPFDAQTSNVPFAALLTGRQPVDSWRVYRTQEFKPLNAAVAVALTCGYTLAVARGRRILVRPRML